MHEPASRDCPAGQQSAFSLKDTVPFLREVRRTHPYTRIATNTNGLVLTPSQIKAIAEESLMDRVIFSIDGANPASYRKYRVGGDLSKALKKMAALVEACREAGTWRRLVSDPPGGVQIAWQYILFEWNDSDEELAEAQNLAQTIGVPIEWVITCGYGASKRFLAGTPEAARLMTGAELFVHMAAPAELANQIQSRELSAFEFDVYTKIRATCDLLSLPFDVSQEPISRFDLIKSWLRKLSQFRGNANPTGYQASFRTADHAFAAPRGATILFQIKVRNCTHKGWDLNSSGFLRLGVQLHGENGPPIELPGVILPSTIANPLGQDMVALRTTMPSDPGNYKLRMDVVQESVCWFSDRGSSPLEFSLQVG